MLLTERDLQKVVARAKDAFPNFSDWEYNNDVNEDYSGFSLWGQLVLGSETLFPRYFFITIDTYKERWRGHLTIGKHCYFWSVANVGDADLLDTGPCKTTGEVIATLKAEIANLFRLFSAS